MTDDDDVSAGTHGPEELGGEDERRRDLWRLYDTAVAEYRFEVRLGDQRFQWYVGLNFAMLTVAAALLRIGSRSEGRSIVIVGFAAGIVLAAFTALITAKQAIYFRAARDQVRKIAAELGVTEWSIQTTGGFKGDPEGEDSRPQVRTVNYTLLATLATLNAAGIAYVIATR